MKNSSRTWLSRENAAFARTVPAGSVVLDAGAGEQPYKTLFAHCRYEAADFELVDKPYARSTYVCDLAEIPVHDECFDAILFNQVMEHLPDPFRVLLELRRVLKPGGRMLCTAPFFYQEHEQPYDFFRYTQFGWRSLMERAGLEIERLDWMEGYLGTLAYQLKTASTALPRRPRDLAPGLAGMLAAPIAIVARFAFGGLARLFYELDERQRLTDRGHPKNYLVIVRRPA